MTTGRVVVLAVTKMLSGMCTGGISLATGAWVRPVKEHSVVLLGDLTYRDRTVMRPFDVVDFHLIRPRSEAPHVEDWVCDFVKVRPCKVGHVAEKRLEFLERYTEPGSEGELIAAERSLTLIEPAEVEATFSLDSYSGKYDARLRVPQMGERPIPVTDIKWRALGRSLLAGEESLCLSSEQIRGRLGAERTFVALGLSRRHEGSFWPLAVGVHLWPDYEAEIDYREL